MKGDRDARAPAEAEALPPTVFVIEEDSEIRFIAAALFCHEGYSVLTAATGHDAIQILRAPFSPIDVIVLDVYLPDIDGIILCARIRELYPTVPVIAWTGEASTTEAARLQDLGVQCYLTKPVPPAELLACVEGVLPACNQSSNVIGVPH